MRTLFVFVLILTIRTSWAQQADCAQQLTLLQDEFNAGHFYGLSAIVNECIEANAFTNEQKVRMYMLLTQAYLLIDDPIAAEDSYLKLLRADPEFVADEKKDPVDVYYLSKKFMTTPRFTPTLLRAGGNISFPRQIVRISTDSRASGETKYGIKAGYQVGSGVDWNWTDNFSLGAEADFSVHSYTSRITGLNMSDLVENSERQFWIDIPIYIKYSQHTGRIRPFAYAGYSLNLLIGSTASLSFTNREATGDLRTQGADENFMYKRRVLNQSFLAGGGFRYKLGKDFLAIDFRYTAGLSNISNGKFNYYDVKTFDDYSMSNTIARYSYIGDYLRLDNFSISLGYVRPLYDPRKIKHARTKAAMKKISKHKTDGE